MINLNGKEISVDYTHSILNISHSLLKYYGVTNTHPTLDILDNALAQNYKNVVLMILDGMGVEVLTKNLPENSFLRQHVTDEISSVFPPTTAAATTAYHSGLSPWESGWLGWMFYNKENNALVETFLNTDFYTGKSLPTPFPIEDMLAYETIYEKIQAQNPELEFHKIFPPFDPVNGVNSFPELCQKIKEKTTASDKRKLFCAYWTEPDHHAHLTGSGSDNVRAIMGEINQQLEQLYHELDDTLVIISADHGEADVTEIYLNDIPEIDEMFLRPPALETRFCAIYVKPEYKEQFPKRIKEVFGEKVLVCTQEEFILSGILGPGKMHPRIPDFLGDFVLLPEKDISLCYTTHQRKYPKLKCHHAGISTPELTVPLILLKKKVKN